MRYSVQEIDFDQRDTGEWHTIARRFTLEGARETWYRACFRPMNGMLLHRIWDNWHKKPVEL